MKAKLCFCLLVSLVLNSANLKGQDSTKIEVPTSAFIQVDISPSYLRNHHDAWNKSLSMAGIPAFEQDILYLTASIKFGINKPFVDRFIFAFSASKYDVFLKSEAPTIPYFYQFKGHAVELSIGYKILNKSNFYLYPYAGFNINFSKLIITHHDTTSINNIADVVNIPEDAHTIDFGNNALDLGMSFERIFKSRTIGGCPRNVRYFSIGIGVGYLTKLSHTNNAYYDRKKISEGQNFGLDGAYIKLSIGYGLKLRRVNWK